MENRLLLGDEALAQGAIDAGLSGAYAYPGTPSTEITEYIQRSPAGRSGRIHCRWSANEKTALEAALGMSYAGKRAMASMKHVGLNVAADPFMNAAIAGTHGGLIVAVADDPSMHSSQNEQDSRFYADFALIPCIEPADQQEAYAAPAHAFRLSEAHQVPVLVRVTTRLAHSRATIRVGEAIPQRALSLPQDPERFVVLPARARKSYARLADLQAIFERESEDGPFTRYVSGPDRSLGIIACGIAFNYLMEATSGNPRHPFLKIGQYPLPTGSIERLLTECKRILVLEEGYPFVEGRLLGVPARRTPRILGRLSGHLPRTGELTPTLVSRALDPGLPDPVPPSPLLVDRPPALCPGCPHATTFQVLKQVLETKGAWGRVFSDIGCYTLGALPPHSIIDTCVEMGASITMAKGASDAGLQPAVAVIGDSTFTHSGMTGLLDCINENSHVTVLILDNLTIAMTGGQRSSATHRLASICRGLGMDEAHIRLIDPHPSQHEKNVAVLEEELAHAGPSVVIAQRECIQTARRKARRQDEKAGER